MLQVIQHQKTGDILVEELPAPECPAGGILVRTSSSLISAGTEKISVENAKASLLERARRQPEDVKMVIDYVKKEGVFSTLKRVKNKLESYKFLGYSASGTVLESNCGEFSPGGRVACAGAGYALHAEIIAVPKNLAALIPENVSFDDAAYTTLGAIAMQGVRQADLRLGENAAVIGLGLLGQIAVQLLKASGCRVAGLDINESLFENAKKFGCDAVFPSSADYINNLEAFTGGAGFDAVIIAASTSSNQPMELALDITRKKGKAVVLGAVGMNIPRGPFYKKEIDLRISCSYGPGRYDAFYEEQGHDYPYAFVRWTENRNMKAVLDLISQGKLDTASLTTHKFDIKRAAQAYELISGKKSEPYLGILLNYPERKDALKRTIRLKNDFNRHAKLRLAFIGAGTFAQNYLIPHLKAPDIELIGVSTATAANAHSAAKKFGFAMSSTNSSGLIVNKDVNAVFCAARHDTHARFVIESVKAGKPVFVEKPLAITKDELDDIHKAVSDNNGRIMVGYNRRFSKPFNFIKKVFSGRTLPMVVNYRVNAGNIPKDHWVHAQGGRIIGEACHFIDTMIYLTGAFPVKIYAENISSSSEEYINRDNALITVKFSDGSAGTVSYLAAGAPAMNKEYCEIFSGGTSAVMNNFTYVEIFRKNSSEKKKYDGSKGQKEEVRETLKAIKDGTPMPIPYLELKAVSAAVFAAVDSLEKGEAVSL